MSCSMTKPTIWPVRPVKTQTSLGICCEHRSFWWFCHDVAHLTDPHCKTVMLPKVLLKSWQINVKKFLGVLYLWSKVPQFPSTEDAELKSQHSSPTTALLSPAPCESGLLVTGALHVAKARLKLQRQDSPCCTDITDLASLWTRRWRLTSRFLLSLGYTGGWGWGWCTGLPCCFYWGAWWRGLKNIS